MVQVRIDLHKGGADGMLNQEYSTDTFEFQDQCDSLSPSSSSSSIQKLPQEQEEKKSRDGTLNLTDSFIKRHFSMDSIEEAKLTASGTTEQLVRHRQLRKAKRKSRRSMKLQSEADPVTGAIKVSVHGLPASARDDESEEPISVEIQPSTTSTTTGRGGGEVQNAVDTAGLTDILRSKPQMGTVVAVTGGSNSASVELGDEQTQKDVSSFLEKDES